MSDVSRWFLSELVETMNEKGYDRVVGQGMIRGSVRGCSWLRVAEASAGLTAQG